MSGGGGRFSALLLEGLDHYRKGKMLEAVRAWEEAYLLEPTNLRAREFLRSALERIHAHMTPVNNQAGAPAHPWLPADRPDLDKTQAFSLPPPPPPGPAKPKAGPAAAGPRKAEAGPRRQCPGHDAACRRQGFEVRRGAGKARGRPGESETGSQACRACEGGAAGLAAVAAHAVGRRALGRDPAGG